MSLKVHYKASDSQCMQVVSIYISQQVFDSSRERSCKSVECCFSHFTKTLSRQYNNIHYKPIVHNFSLCPTKCYVLDSSDYSSQNQ